MAKKAGVMCDDHFGNVFRCVIARIRRNLTSAFYERQPQKDAAAALCISHHCGEQGWTDISRSLFYAGSTYYMYLTRDKSSELMGLKAYRETKQYTALLERFDAEYMPRSRVLRNEEPEARTRRMEKVIIQRPMRSGDRCA